MHDNKEEDNSRSHDKAWSKAPKAIIWEKEAAKPTEQGDIS